MVGDRHRVEPGGAAAFTSSAGLSVPSDSVEWVCRSMTTSSSVDDAAHEPCYGTIFLPRAARWALIIENRSACAFLSPKVSSEMAS